jgi:hypothetical protein
MKNDINTASEIKIKLISNNFFNMDNLLNINNYLNHNRVRLVSVDIGIDRVIKFETVIPTYDVIRSYELVYAMRSWGHDNELTLKSILTEEEFHFLELHFEMLYTIETFNYTNAIYIRI